VALGIPKGRISQAKKGEGKGVLREGKVGTGVKKLKRDELRPEGDGDARKEKNTALIRLH